MEGPTAGVILLHARWGLSADVLARADRLRAGGYTVVTPDLFGGRVVATIEDTTKVLPPVLSHYPELDELEDLGATRMAERELRAAGTDVRVEPYPMTKHWFDEPSRPEYDAAASALAWERTDAFLRGHLGAPRPSR